MQDTELKDLTKVLKELTGVITDIKNILVVQQVSSNIGIREAFMFPEVAEEGIEVNIRPEDDPYNEFFEEEVEPVIYSSDSKKEAIYKEFFSLAESQKEKAKEDIQELYRDKKGHFEFDDEFKDVQTVGGFIITLIRKRLNSNIGYYEGVAYNELIAYINSCGVSLNRTSVFDFCNYICLRYEQLVRAKDSQLDAKAKAYSYAYAIASNYPDMSIQSRQPRYHQLF